MKIRTTWTLTIERRRPEREPGPEGADSDTERAEPHDGPSIGFRIPDADPETWEDKR